MTIKDIKRFIDWCIEGDATIDKRLELIDQQRDAVLHQIEQLMETLAVLNYKHWYYETAKEAGTCAVHQNIDLDKIPEEFHVFKKRMTE